MMMITTNTQWAKQKLITRLSSQTIFFCYLIRSHNVSGGIHVCMPLVVRVPVLLAREARAATMLPLL